MRASVVLDRARRCIGQGCAYKLGYGGRDPAWEYPWGKWRVCDCSGFVAWALGVPRKLVGVPWYEHVNGGWFETTALALDARSRFGFVDEVEWKWARPGDLLVYGDQGGHQGHVGIVGAVDPDGPRTAIHCSLGNYRRCKDAIRETGVELWRERGGLIARVAFVGFES